MPYDTEIGIFEERHARADVLAAHRHTRAYAALVLGGSYYESSADGRFHCRPGMLIIHPAWHEHRNEFSHEGACTLSFPLTEHNPLHRYMVAEYGDWGLLVRTARRKPADAAAMLAEAQLNSVAPAAAAPWCQALADALKRGDRDIDLPVSRAHACRSFRRHFGQTPSAYRAEWRRRRALQLVRSGLSLAQVAVESGYADQSHLTRDLHRVTGATPKTLSRS